MENKPQIFVSSTIYDFSDLRSALKYWLNEIGYEVRMSEYNDFIKDSHINSYDACLDAIAQCDYFILLIGSRVGGLYSKNPKISITQKEYQTAYNLLKEGKIKRIFTFVRRDIWTIKEDRKALYNLLISNYCDEKEINTISNHKSQFLNDAEFIFDFIKEVGRIQDMKEAVSEGDNYPQGNWINQFSSFEDIVLVLKSELRIRSNISYIRWAEIILQEIASNLTHLSIRYIESELITPYFLWAYSFRCKVPEMLGEPFVVDKKSASSASMFATMGCIELCNLNSDMLIGAIQSGVFLEYDNDRHDYFKGNIQRALIEMLNNINLAKRLSASIDADYMLRITNRLSNNVKEENVTIRSYEPDIMTLLAAYDCQYNIWELSRYLFAVLKFNYDKSKFPDIKPKGVFKYSPDDMFYRKLSTDDIYDYFNTEKSREN